jgi:hypothetical protein
MTQRIGNPGGLLHRRAPAGVTSPLTPGSASSPLAPGKQTLTSQLDAAPGASDVGSPSLGTTHAAREARHDGVTGVAPRGPSPSYLAQLHQSFGRPDG